MVGRAIGVGSELFELLQTKAKDVTIEGDPNPSVILMTAHTLELEALAVEKEASVCIECHVADAKVRGALVEGVPFAREFHFSAVQMGRS